MMNTIYCILITIICSSQLFGIQHSAELENQFFEKWINDPTELYQGLVGRKRTATQDKPFALPEMMQSVTRIKDEIDRKLSDSNELGYVTSAEMKALRQYSCAFHEIINANVPYERAISLIYSYLEFMDGIFKRLCPELPDSIAKLLTEHNFSNITSTQDAFLMFSYRELDIDFFIKTRPIPLYIIGMVEYPPFSEACHAKIRVDGSDTEVGGFSHHDAEHARADYKIDRALLSQLNNPVSIVGEWQQTRNLILSRIDKLKNENADLAQAVTILLFEMLHERGLQYDLGLLKSYLNLPLFSKTTKDKWRSLFWYPLPGKEELYDLFDDAVLWLNDQISDLLIQQNRDRLGKKYSEIATIDKITMQEGYAERVEFLDGDDIRVHLVGGVTVSLYNIKTFGLVEVNPSDSDFVSLPGKSRFLQTKYYQLLKLVIAKKKFEYKVIETGHLITDAFIGINERTNEACFPNYSIPLDSIVVSDSSPLIGMGTAKLELESLVTGLKHGISVIDTAKAYENEEIVGRAMYESGVNPDSVTVITKLSRPYCENKETVRRAVLDSIKKIGKVPEYILIHGPYPDVPMLSLIQALEDLKNEGLVKEWGVSNFDIEHLKILVSNGYIPSLNQVEYHPFFQRTELLEYCKEHGILMQAYRPLTAGIVLENTTIRSIAAAHNTSPATVVYAWLMQQKIPFVTKVSSALHQKDLLQSWQIQLSKDELEAIASLNYPEEKGRTCTKGGWFISNTVGLPQNEKFKSW